MPRPEAEPKPRQISELEYRSMMGQLRNMAEEQVGAVDTTIESLEWYQNNGYRIKYYFNEETGVPSFEAITKKWGF